MKLPGRRSLTKWFHILGLLLFWPALAVVVWGQLRHEALSIERENFDKVLHFIAYFGLAGLATLAFETRKITKWAVLALVLFGGVMELIQGVVGRDMSALDELANALGALCGWGIGLLTLALIRKAKP